MIKKITQILTLVACSGFGMSAHASLITETWEATVTKSENNNLFYEIGDTVRWDATYDDASTENHLYNDGPDGIARTADDILISTGSPGGVITFTADAVFDISDIFANLLGTSSEADAFDVNMSWRYDYLVSDPITQPFTQYIADSEQFYSSLNGEGAFINHINDFASGGVIESYIDFNNASIIETKPTVPEPATLALFGIGLAGLGFARKKKKSA